MTSLAQDHVDQFNCDIRNNNLNRDWKIEVESAASPFGRHVRITVSDGDIEAAAITLSKAFPTERTVVRGLGKLRIAYINGEVTEEYSHFGLQIADNGDRHRWYEMMFFDFKGVSL